MTQHVRVTRGAMFRDCRPIDQTSIGPTTARSSAADSEDRRLNGPTTLPNKRWK
jgi:hypothetical protein